MPHQETRFRVGTGIRPVAGRAPAWRGKGASAAVRRLPAGIGTLTVSSSAQLREAGVVLEMLMTEAEQVSRDSRFTARLNPSDVAHLDYASCSSATPDPFSGICGGLAGRAVTSAFRLALASSADRG